MNRTRTWRLLAVLAALALLGAACGSDDDGGDESSSDTTEAGSCDTADLPVKEEGQLTVATGDPVFPPWMENDDPTSNEGFESELVYLVAEQLGFSEDQVVWTSTGFDEAIAPGEKDYDFNIQQYGITEDRDEVVDFSDGYYTVEQAIVAPADSDIASAESLADLADAKLGAAVGTTSLDYIEEAIQPSEEAAVFDDTAAASSALQAGQVDGLVYDLPTAFYITAVEIPDASIVGILPVVGEAEELGMLFEDGSPLVPCVNDALAAVEESGDLAALQEEWLANGGETPTLSE
ncbi:MAG: amino acid ABC transporter substrate-binding protein [Acidimicrobiales bacterium]|nr:amino acid ABC transporter substrate-binding protein [Acidimicrobiales bacterium]MCB9371772.1 amino acid ABC transporter substrate-binding protein [Microthrixaceae bacterium]